MDKQKFIDQIIFHDDDRWVVLGAGAQRDGNTFCHLASTSRGRQQKNGWMPVLPRWCSGHRGIASQ